MKTNKINKETIGKYVTFYNNYENEYSKYTNFLTRGYNAKFNYFEVKNLFILLDKFRRLSNSLLSMSSNLFNLVNKLENKIKYNKDALISPINSNKITNIMYSETNSYDNEIIPNKNFKRNNSQQSLIEDKNNIYTINNKTYNNKNSNVISMSSSCRNIKNDTIIETRLKFLTNCNIPQWKLHLKFLNFEVSWTKLDRD